jgi:glycosyltransferase involved in cell wall biosynthesis
MDRSRFSNTVVSISVKCDKFATERLSQAGIGFSTIAMRSGWPNPAGVVRLLRIIRTVRPTILQTWMYHADLLGLLVGKLARVPVILWNIRCTRLDMGWISRSVVRALIPLSPIPTAVISNSQAGVRVHQQLGYKPKEWIWIPNSLDLAEFKPQPEARPQLRRELKLAASDIVVGLVARCDPKKDHVNFVRAARLIAIEYPRVNFALVGQGADRSNQQLLSVIQSEGVQGRFHLMGLRDDISSITSAFDIACSSSSAEGLSNTISEAMACGVPCVATDVGDSALLLGDTGKIVPSQDPQAFAAACCELLALSPGQRFQFGMRGRERVRQYFSLSAVVARYQNLYQELTARLPA